MIKDMDKKDEKRIQAKRCRVTFDEENEHCDDDYDQDEIDKVLHDQEFPTRKVSSNLF